MLWTWLIFPPRSHPSPHWQQKRTAVVSLCLDVRRGLHLAVESDHTELNIHFASNTRFLLAAVAVRLCQSNWCWFAAILFVFGGRWEPQSRSGLAGYERSFSFIGEVKDKKKKKNVDQHTTIRSDQKQQCLLGNDVLKTPTRKSSVKCCKLWNPKPNGSRHTEERNRNSQFCHLLPVGNHTSCGGRREGDSPCRPSRLE